MHFRKPLRYRLLTSLVAVLGLHALTAAEAYAETVTYNLNQSNADTVLADGVNYLQVSIASNLPGTASFTVTPVYAFTQGSNYGLQSFGFNYAGTSGALTFSGLASGWSVGSNSNQDGFGKFEYVLSANGNNRLSPLIFTVSNLGGASTAQSLGYFQLSSSGNAGQGNQYFAAHLTGFTAGSVTSAYFAGSSVAVVPEPENYAMLLAGLSLVGAIARRRLLK